MSNDFDAPKPQCWAYGPQGSRCVLGAGHLDPHRVEWSDAECIDPAQAAQRVQMVLAPPVPAFPPPPGPVAPSGLLAVPEAVQERFSGPVHTTQPTEPIKLSEEGREGPPGSCFACGCRAPHPCQAHDCRTFVA